MKRPLLEVHIPISPHENFFTMLHYLVESFRLNSQLLYKDTKFVITVSRDGPYQDLSQEIKWARHYWMEWRWVERNKFSKFQWFATAAERYRYSYQSEMVLMLDADVIISGPLESMIQESYQTDSFMGLIDYGSPFKHPSMEKPIFWKNVFDEAGLPEPEGKWEYSLWSKERDASPEHRYGPPYFNQGVIAAPRGIISKLGKTIYMDMDIVKHITNERFPFRFQVAVTLSLIRHQISWKPLDMKYNFPCTLYDFLNIPVDVEDIRIMHYVTNGRRRIKKQEDFANPAMVEKMLQKKKLHEALRLFQAQVSVIHRSLQHFDAND